MQEIAELLGLTNVFADLDGWAQVSEEQVLSRNPDYIVTTDGRLRHRRPPPRKKSWRAPDGNGVTAVQNGDVFFGFGDAMTRPGPRLCEGARQLRDAVLAP